MHLEFEHLVREYYQPMYRFALSLSGSPADACDLVQQTCMLWAERGHQIRDRDKAKSWLFTTLYREFLRGRRHADRFPHLELVAVESELPSISAESIHHLEAREVMEALQQVDDVFRTPLSLFYSGGHSYLEIATILDVPAGTVMSRIARGKQQLRAYLHATQDESARRRHVARQEQRIHEQR